MTGAYVCKKEERERGEVVTLPIRRRMDECRMLLVLSNTDEANDSHAVVKIANILVSWTEHDQSA